MAYSIVCDCCGRQIPANETYYETVAKRWACDELAHKMEVYRSLNCDVNAHYCAECYEPPRPRRGNACGDG